MAGLAEIPAVIRDVPDEAAVAMALIENIQREDLNPLEEARALPRLIEEFGLTHQAGGRGGRAARAPRSAICCGSWSWPTRSRSCWSSAASRWAMPARCWGLTARRQQIEVAGLVAKKGLSVRDTEALVRRIMRRATAEPGEPPAADPDIQRLERELADKLGAKVAFQHAASGKGKLVVTYNSLDELEGILAHIQ